jgi:hypothetical protein
MEDSIDLANALASENWKRALSEYELKMLKRGFKNSKTSMASTNMLTLKGWKASMRESFMSLMGWGMWLYNSVPSVRGRT